MIAGFSYVFFMGLPLYAVLDCDRRRVSSILAGPNARKRRLIYAGVQRFSSGFSLRRVANHEKVVRAPYGARIDVDLGIDGERIAELRLRYS